MKTGDTTILSDSVFAVAMYVGGQRHAEAVKKGSEDRHGLAGAHDLDKILAHRNGVVGEAGFSQMNGSFWYMSVNALKSDPDVFPDWQVRWTDDAERTGLIIRPGDPTHHKYALTTSNGKLVTYHGWVWGHEAIKRQDCWRDPGNRKKPCWFIPVEDLTSET